MNDPKAQGSLKQLHRLGQSPWLDFIERGLIDSGELKRMVDQDGIRGVTSNPAIFERDLAGAHAHLYEAEVPGDCPASDYTVLVIPHHPDVLVPLEENRILWEH